MKWSYIENDTDTALVQYAKTTEIESKCTWQANTLGYVMSFYNKKTFRRCIDAGANYGFLSVGFSRYFDKVESFEISPVIRKHLNTNINGISNIKSHPVGLYNSEKEVKYKLLSTSGMSRISIDGKGELEKVNTLDSFNFKDVDLIKIDVEHSELELIEGAIETIKSSLPVIVMEMDFNRADRSLVRRQKLLGIMYSLGYKIVDIRHNDVLFING